MKSYLDLNKAMNHVDSFKLNSIKFKKGYYGDFSLGYQVYGTISSSGNLLIESEREIYLPEGLKFWRYNNLRSIKDPDRILKTSNVTDMSEMFKGCKKLEDISALATWDVANVKNMSEMFKGCKKLEDIFALATWDVANVANMSEMFADSGVSEVDAIERWNVNFAEYEDPFEGLEHVKSIFEDTAVMSYPQWYEKELEKYFAEDNLAKDIFGEEDMMA